MRQRSVTDVSCEKYWRRESFFNKRKYSAAKKYSNPFPAACKCLFLFNFNIGTEKQNFYYSLGNKGKFDVM